MKTVYRKATRQIAAVAFTLLTLSSSTLHAQLWHAWPKLGTTDPATERTMASFSHDEKKVFWISTENGASNIWSVPVKGGKPVQITHFTDVNMPRMIHMLNRPLIVLQRKPNLAAPEYHLYRISDNDSGEVLDLTPTEAGVDNQMIGASYNGRYIYYTSNKRRADAIDTWRYDTQQNTAEMVFPNDKDFETLAWTRDHNKLLIQEPGTGDLYLFDINETLRTLLDHPANGPYIEAMLDPTSKKLLAINKRESGNELYSRDLSAATNETRITGDFHSVDYSPNGKYWLSNEHGVWKVKEGGTEVPLPAGAIPAFISPKETMILYTLSAETPGKKLYLYDIVKKTSLELGAVR